MPAVVQLHFVLHHTETKALFMDPVTSSAKMVAGQFTEFLSIFLFDGMGPFLVQG